MLLYYVSKRNFRWGVVARNGIRRDRRKISPTYGWGDAEYIE